MAEPDDLNLDELKRRGRRRLIGAIVLALVAAVVVPMLLENEPKPLGEDVSVRIPPVDEGKFVNKLGETAPRKSLADAEKAVLTPGARPAAPAESKAAPDDGVLEVGVVTAEGAVEWSRVLARMAAGKAERSPMARTTAGRKIDVRLDDAQPWELDGGDRPKVKKLKIRVDHHAIEVCVPETTEEVVS